MDKEENQSSDTFKARFLPLVGGTTFKKEKFWVVVIEQVPSFKRFESGNGVVLKGDRKYYSLGGGLCRIPSPKSGLLPIKTFLRKVDAVKLLVAMHEYNETHEYNDMHKCNEIDGKKQTTMHNFAEAAQKAGQAFSDISKSDVSKTVKEIKETNAKTKTNKEKTSGNRS